MTGTARRSARAALDAARPVVARLDASRGPEDLAADLIEAWSAVETALRSLVGGSPLAGQALIREARQRQLINFDQGNAIAEFQAVRDRLEDASYRPTENDVTAAKTAFAKFESSVMADEAPNAYVASPSLAGPTLPTPDSTLTMEPLPSAGRGMPPWAMLLILVVVLGGVAVGGYYAFAGRGGGGALERGIQDYNNRQREAAVGEFNKAVRDNPKDPVPHVYLARMAREAGNMTTASAEAVTAVRLGPNNGVALRELASVSFAQQNYDAARRFYIRAVQADSSDKLSQGFLGCSLIRLGRIDEGMRWINRAGPGAWSGCAPQPGAPAGAQPGMQAVPPSGALPPR